MDDLLRRFVVMGEGAAMEELVRATRPALLRVARRIGAPQDADDAVQAAYLALVRRGAKPLDAPVFPWLLTAVVRIAYRNKALAKRRVEAATRLSDWTEGTPLDQTIRRDEALSLRREVTRLPADYRDALVLHYLEGLPIDDVAALLDTSPSAVKMRLLRGRALLRSRLGVRLGYSLLWLPWTLSDAGAAALGGVVTKKLAIASVLALGAGTTLLAVKGAERVEPAPRASPLLDARSVDAGADAPPAAAPADHAFISGRIVDETGAPLQGAGVFIRRYDAEGRPRWFYPYETEPDTRSDSTGGFAVRDPVERFESIWIVRPGYVAVQAPAGAGRLNGNEIVLQRAQRAEGRILDTEGRPIPGASVYFGMLTVHADDQGRYRADILPPPPWPIRVGAPGYEPGSATTDGDIRLRRGVVMAEPLDARTGAPLLEARGLLVFGRSGALLRPLVPTHEFETAELRCAPGRLYAFGAFAREGGPSDVDLHLFAPGREPFVARVRLAPGSEPPHVVARMPPGDGTPAVAGRIEGAARATIEIRLGDRPGTSSSDEHRVLLQTVDTAADGSFAVTGLPRGRYRLIARAEGKGVLATEIQSPVVDVLLRMSPVASLTVTGVDDSGTPVAGAWIHVESAESGRVWEQQTDALGRAVFPDLPAGRALLCPARFQGFSARNSTAPLAEFDLAPGDAVARRVEVPLERDFVLTVVNGEGAAIPGVSVAVRPGAGFGWVFHQHPSYRPQAEADARGQVSFPLYPGTYVATVLRDGVTHTPKFEVGAERSARIVLSDGPVLRGSVVDATTGKPVGLEVRVRQGKQRLGNATTSEVDGGFAIPCPVQGPVTLEMWPPDASSRSLTPYPYLVRGEVEVGRELLVALPRVRGEGVDLPVTAEVLVTDAETGAALDGANVSYEALRDGLWMSVTDWIRTGSDGRASGRVMRGDRYRAIVAGPWDGPVTYTHQEIECVAATDAIRLGVALVRQPK